MYLDGPFAYLGISTSCAARAGKTPALQCAPHMVEYGKKKHTQELSHQADFGRNEFMRAELGA